MSMIRVGPVTRSATEKELYRADLRQPETVLQWVWIAPKGM